MNKAEAHKYYNDRFNEIPLDMFPKIAEIFNNSSPMLTIVDISRKMIREKGLNYWFIDNHFGAGMQIRNLLRENGILDGMFPTQNLDDYYIVMMEWWLGYREV
jgi:hypothetical protein